MPRNFLGASIKNIAGLGEVSAYGLPGEVGTLLVQVPAGTAADKAGLKQGDVILKCQGRDISNIDDLFKSFGNPVKRTKITLDIWRLQQHVTIDITI